MSDRERREPPREYSDEELESKLDELETAFGGLNLLVIPYFPSWSESTMRQWEKFNLSNFWTNVRSKDMTRRDLVSKLENILVEAKEFVQETCLVPPGELTNDRLVKIVEASPPNRLSYKKPKESIH